MQLEHSLLLVRELQLIQVPLTKVYERHWGHDFYVALEHAKHVLL